MLINEMNIRHNNTDPTDKRRFNPKLAKMSQDELEGWYDLLYEQALGLFVVLEQQNRNKKIEAYKHLNDTNLGGHHEILQA